MRALHLCTLDLRGGAARSAWRLHQGLRDEGIESRLLVRTKLSDDITVAAADDGTVATWHERILTPWLHQRLPANSPWFTCTSVSQSVAAHPWVQEADVIHLHWVAEWLGAKDIAALAALGKPVFWTFHDLWAVACGNHYPGSDAPGDDEWQTGNSLPDEIREIGHREFSRKRDHLAPLDLHVIAPSQWIGRMSRDSHIGASWPVSIVPYGVDTRIFQPADSAVARGRWQLPEDKRVLLFGCAALGERRKGYHVLVDALRSASLDGSHIQLVTFGAGDPDLSALPVPARHVGPISRETDMASLYSAADAYLCPTLEDNLPNTVLESLACGTPVIGFSTGGVPDLVQHERNGLLAPCGSAPALADCLSRFVTDPVLRDQLKSGCMGADMAQFTLQTQARRCTELYRKALAGVRTSPGAPAAEVDSALWRPTATLEACEQGWALQAAAAATRAAVAEDARLSAELAKTKSRLAEAKKHLGSWKAKAKSIKLKSDEPQRSAWHKWFGRR